MTREAAQRDGGGRDSGSKPRRQSAPRAFGTNDHGRGMEAEDDVAGGERCDDEGMVYAMHVDGPPCIYFCDRFRRYRFFAKHAGLALLKGLVAANCRNLDANAVLFSDDAEEANRQRAEGYALYEEKPNLRRVGTEIGTWSDGEYGLPGFQWMYLRLKSFQRFTETWALLERCAAAGLFDADASLCLGGRGADKLRVVSLGGGPGYELLAYDWFDRCFDAVASGKAVDMAAAAQARAKDWAALAERRPDEAAADFASLDLQPSWDTYVHSLDYGFTQWDVHADGADSAVVGDSDRVVCMLSNIMCYCTDDQTAELFAKLLCGGRVKAILGNERGAEQRIIPKLERLGIVVVRLLDQANAGRDDRQFAFLPPRSKLPRPRNLPLADDFVRIFPNVPYEEKKGVKTM
ncbi:hypothetical protein M885DRAFT_165253 [Pelagophyceae sp. CCMP2097]|nr:hypothetical protein M885DRAFT_165253 [Pelagophyceae sp. CCMP2097]